MVPHKKMFMKCSQLIFNLMMQIAKSKDHTTKYKNNVPKIKRLKNLINLHSSISKMITMS